MGATLRSFQCDHLAGSGRATGCYRARLTAEWVHWFNLRRLYEYCGDKPPAELETAHYARYRGAAAG
jgi:transposase InsO family protein